MIEELILILVVINTICLISINISLKKINRDLIIINSHIDKMCEELNALLKKAK